MTNNEIIKALECCFEKPNCIGCPLRTEKLMGVCTEKLTRECFGLIKQQQEMIEALIAGQESLQKHFMDKLDKIVEMLKMCAVNEPLMENGVTVGTVKVMPLPIALEIVKGVQND